MDGEADLDIGDLPLPRVTQPEPDSSTAAGIHDAFDMPPLHDIAEAQRQHPATAPYFDFHISGTTPADLTPQEEHAFKLEIALTFVVLRRVLRAAGTKGPIVLPPVPCSRRPCVP